MHDNIYDSLGEAPKVSPITNCLTLNDANLITKLLITGNQQLAFRHFQTAGQVERPFSQGLSTLSSAQFAFYRQSANT